MSNRSNDKTITGIYNDPKGRVASKFFGVGVTDPIGQLHLASGDNKNNVIIEAGTTTNGAQVGWSAINFNGYFDGTERRIDPTKSRWRFICDQRPGFPEGFSLDSFDGTNTFRYLRTSPNSTGVQLGSTPCWTGQTSTLITANNHTFTVPQLLNGFAYRGPTSGAITQMVDSLPSAATFLSFGLSVPTILYFTVFNIVPGTTYSLTPTNNTQTMTLSNGRSTTTYLISIQSGGPSCSILSCQDDRQRIQIGSVDTPISGLYPVVFETPYQQIPRVICQLDDLGTTQKSVYTSNITTTGFDVRVVGAITTLGSVRYVAIG